MSDQRAAARESRSRVHGACSRSQRRRASGRQRHRWSATHLLADGPAEAAQSVTCPMAAPQPRARLRGPASRRPLRANRAPSATATPRRRRRREHGRRGQPEPHRDRAARPAAGYASTCEARQGGQAGRPARASSTHCTAPTTRHHTGVARRPDECRRPPGRACPPGPRPTCARAPGPPGRARHGGAWPAACRGRRARPIAGPGARQPHRARAAASARGRAALPAPSR